MPEVTSTLPAPPSTANANPSDEREASSVRPNGAPKATAGPNVFALYGVEPEVQAYAMAKYSRSALSMKDSLRELNEQKAEQFLNTFYFQYGHRSIADLAHIAMAVEKLSILAAIALVDEQRWDGQERSTRYQNFKKSGWYAPEFGDNQDAAGRYDETLRFLFAEYEVFSEGIFRWLMEKTPRPEEMKQDQYERTLRARAFDVSRYLLPLATNTSLGQIVNARTLETQISRLLAHTHGEVRQLAELLKAAAKEPAYNLNHEKTRELMQELATRAPELAERFAALALKDVRVGPTLVKYANVDAYALETRRELEQAATELMRGVEIAASKPVELLEDEPLEIELAATLLYGHCHHPYRQIRERVESLDGRRRGEIIALGAKHRGKYDELARAFCSGQRFRFDILMDIGGFRDMHRHRRCIQIEQGYTTAHGYDTPEELRPAGLLDRYTATMARASNVHSELKATAGADADYVLPLAIRKRTLFKMDFAEAVYIAELRTTPAGHISYRKVAYAMFAEVARKYPGLAPMFRVTGVDQPVDLLQR